MFVVTNGNAEFREEAGDVLPTDMSDSSDSEPEKHNRYRLRSRVDEG